MYPALKDAVCLVRETLPWDAMMAVLLVVAFLDIYEMGRRVLGMGRKRTILLLEGNICAGKSTLCEALTTLDNNGRAHGWRHVLEPVHGSLLREFSEKEAKNNAFTFQMVMHERRTHALELALLNNSHDTHNLVLDRSLVGDFAFALWNYIDGAITEHELELYLDDQRDELSILPRELLARVDKRVDRVHVVLLAQPAKLCCRRLVKRGNVDSEMSLRYLTGISIAHYMAMMRVVADKRLASLVSLHLIDELPALHSGTISAPKSAIGLDKASIFNENDLRQFVDGLETSIQLPDGSYYMRAHNSKIVMRNSTTISLDEQALERYEKVCTRLNVTPLYTDGKAKTTIDERSWHLALYRKMLPAPTD